MSDVRIRGPLHCVEVRSDGRVVKPLVRHDDADEGLPIPPGQASASLFDGPSRLFARALLDVMRRR